MRALTSILRNPLSLFSFLFAKTSKEERIAAYIIREHDRGKTIDDILDDPYIRNRMTGQEVGRVLERPDVLRAIGDDMVEAGRAALAQTRQA